MTEYTYEKQLGFRNVGRMKVIKGPNIGKVFEWATKTGPDGRSYPAMIPDQFENNATSKGFKIVSMPPGLPVVKMVPEGEYSPSRAIEIVITK